MSEHNSFTCFYIFIKSLVCEQWTNESNAWVSKTLYIFFINLVFKSLNSRIKFLYELSLKFAVIVNLTFKKIMVINRLLSLNNFDLVRRISVTFLLYSLKLVAVPFKNKNLQCFSPQIKIYICFSMYLVIFLKEFIQTVFKV